MSTAVSSPPQLDRECESAGRLLSESFGVDFRLWLAQGDTWVAARPGEVSDAPPHTLCQVAPGDAPQVISNSHSARTLAIPLQFGSRRVVALGPLTEKDASDCDRLTRFARLAQREIAQQREIDRLSMESQGFVRQVTIDFEELVYLRSMAELLEISDLSFDFVAMAETILPTLQPLCDAESMVLVTAAESEEGETPRVESPRLWFGSRTVSSASCLRLVEDYREAAQKQPVVKNGFDKTAEGTAYAGVNSFVMVTIVNANKVIGWMLALNRNNEENLWLNDVPWDFSYLEFGTHEATLMSSSAAILATHARNVELFRERERLLISVVRALVSAVEAKDEYTRGHSERVALYGQRLAKELGLNDDYCRRLYLTGLLHDVGKIGVRDAVLRKPGPLTPEEFEEIKEHPDKGWEILQDLQPLKYVLPGVLHHHEQVDGQGYPDELANDEIPLDGRILAVADAYDAMTSDRSYRPGMPQEKAEAILRSGAGTQWDAKLVAAFFQAMPDIRRIKENYRPRETRKRRRKSGVAAPASGV